MTARCTSLAALACVALILSGTPAVAQAPTTIGLQGVLRAAGGGPVADGDYVLEFSVWDAAKDGKSLWKEGPSAMKIVGGTFGWALGSKSPLSAAALAGPRFLQVKVGTEPPLPRIPIRSVPWALRAGVAGDLQ